MSLSKEQTAKTPVLAEICSDLYLYASITIDAKEFHIGGDNLVSLTKSELCKLITELQSIHSQMI